MCRTASLRVEHQRGRAPGLVAVQLAQPVEPAQVGGDVEAALEFHRLQAALRELLVQPGQFLVRQRPVQARRVRRYDVVAGTEEPPQRLLGRLGLEVPQRHVERADGTEDRAGVTALEYPGEHPVVQRDHRARILAVQGGEERVHALVRTQTDPFEADVGGE